MKLTIKNISSDLVEILINGKFTIENAHIFGKETSQLLKHGFKTVLLNLLDMGYIDSSGFGELIKFMNKAKNSGTELIIYNLQKEISGMFNTFHLDNFFIIKTAQELKELFPELKL